MTTTGIYCREGCPARPLESHVIGFEHAAAAEAAGFRACHRCRPYRNSDPSPWLSGPEVVCRGVRLILDGALDAGSEHELAARLGVSARHLRRLFAQHVGTTPDGVARSRRAHFARRLLDETDLSVADVGFASGFGSVRQMNRVMQDVFHASPSALRARRRRSDRLVADGGLELRVPFLGPLDWRAMLDFLGPRATPGVERVDAGHYRRTILIGGHPGVLEVGSDDDRDHLLLRAHLPRWEGLIHVVERVRRIFDLDADLRSMSRQLRGDPLLRDRIRRRPGLRVAGAWDGFEVAVRTVIGQQVSVSAATSLAGRLVQRFGTPVPGLEPLGLTHVFPDPAALVDADLETVGLTRARAATVRELAGRSLDGALPLDASISVEDTTAALCEIPGVGPWTAHYVAMRACNERDAFPWSDLGLRRAAGNGEPLSPRDLEIRSRAWRPWRAYAAMHLWTA